MSLTSETADQRSPSWLEGVPELDRRILELAIGAEPAVLPQRSALIVVDVLLGFTGTRPLPILDAIAEYPTSCGEHAWAALPAIRRCIDAFRAAELPVIWIRGLPKPIRGDRSATRGRRRGQLPDGLDPNAIHELVQPEPAEKIVEKARASAFFDTELRDHLAQTGIEGVVIVGCTTSGCVRASAVDAHSAGHDTFVVHDACFDRSQFAHRGSLFDLSGKYATVLGVDELVQQLERTPA